MKILIITGIIIATLAAILIHNIFGKTGLIIAVVITALTGYFLYKIGYQGIIAITGILVIIKTGKMTKAHIEDKQYMKRLHAPLDNKQDMYTNVYTTGEWDQ